MFHEGPTSPPPHPASHSPNARMPAVAHPRPSPRAAPQVLFKDGRLQWERLENLILLAREGSTASSRRLTPAQTAAAALRSSAGAGASSSSRSPSSFSSDTQGLDLTDTVMDALKVLLTDDRLRTQVCGQQGRRGGCGCTAALGRLAVQTCTPN